MFSDVAQNFCRQSPTELNSLGCHSYGMGRISTKQKLGNILKEQRKNKGWSQEQLSFAAKVDRSYISEIENGQRNPSLQTLNKLAKALEVKISDLTNI